MKLLFVHDHRFVEKDGVVYSNQFPASVLSRYLEVFDNLTVVGRKHCCNENVIDKLPVSTMKGVQFVFMPSISTPKSFLFGRRAVYKQIADLIRGHDRVIVRLPSELGLLTARIARSMNRGYAVELVGCPLDALWYYGTILARLYAPVQAARSRHAVRNAEAVCYVTEDYLQKRYPAGIGAIKANVSNVSISTTVDASRLVTSDSSIKRARVGVIGSLHTRYKGVHTAIEAVAGLARVGIDVELRILGGGDSKTLAAQADQLRVSDRVFFDGTLPSGAAVNGWLDRLDIYVQPSLTEGLPRALIEAMSRGLPAAASNVGGIPELLGDDYLFRPGDAAGLANRLRAFVVSPNMRVDAGRANLEIASKYLKSILDSRRKDFLRAVRKCEVDGVEPHFSLGNSTSHGALTVSRERLVDASSVVSKNE